MNLCDGIVTEVLSEPYFKYGCWWVDVNYLSWSDTPSETNLMFHCEEDARAVLPGYKFLA